MAEQKNETEVQDKGAAVRKLLDRLKVAGSLAGKYAALAVALLALVLAYLAGTREAVAPNQLNDANAKIADLGARLAAANDEIAKLQFIHLQEKSGREELRRKQDEMNRKVVESVSRLQTKMKISPTLDEALRREEQAAQAAAASAPAAAEPVAKAPAPAATPAPIPAPAPHAKQGTQAQSIKDAIEKFNR